MKISSYIFQTTKNSITYQII